jgi:hypothetical protein
MAEDPKLYEKIFDIFLALRDTRERFKTYSAQDIKKLIAAKLNAKTQKEPAPLQELYNLEKMITELRHTFIETKDRIKEKELAEKN